MLFEQVRDIIYRAFTKLAGDIKTINKKLDSVQLYQNYVETELDYAFLQGTANTAGQNISIATNVFINQYLTFRDTNMDIDENGSVLCKKGRKYKITCSMMSNTNGIAIYIIDNNKTRIRATEGLSAGYTATSSYSATPCIIFFQPEEDTYVNAMYSGTANTWVHYSKFVIEEVGREVSYDSSESGGAIPTVAENGGLEITPNNELKMISPIEVQEVEGSVVDYIPKATTEQYGVVKVNSNGGLVITNDGLGIDKKIESVDISKYFPDFKSGTVRYVKVGNVCTVYANPIVFNTAQQEVRIEGVLPKALAFNIAHFANNVRAIMYGGDSRIFAVSMNGQTAAYFTLTYICE